MNTPQSTPSSSNGPSDQEAERPFFATVEEERSFHARKAEQYKAALSGQVTEIKETARDKIRKGVLVGGALLGSYVLVRWLTGSKKVWIETPDGPVRIKRKESALWSLFKAGALLGAGFAAREPVMRAVERTLAPEPESGLDASDLNGTLAEGDLETAPYLSDGDMAAAPYSGSPFSATDAGAGRPGPAY